MFSKYNTEILMQVILNLNLNAVQNKAGIFIHKMTDENKRSYSRTGLYN